METRSKDELSWCAPRRDRWSSADGAAMVAAYRSSGLTIRGFSDAYGVSKNRVTYWRDRVELAGTRGFVEARVVARSGPVELPLGLALTLRNGRKVGLTGSLDEAALVRWIRAMEAM